MLTIKNGDLGDATTKTYIYDMFVRKKKNRSGTTSVVVVDKHGGKFKELHTVGIANSDEEIEKLLIKVKPG